MPSNASNTQRGARKPRSQSRNPSQDRDRTTGIDAHESRQDLEAGITAIDRGAPIGASGPQEHTGERGTEGRSSPAPDTDGGDPAPGAPSIGTPSLGAILAPLSSPKHIGEIVGIFFDTIADQRGDHWRVDEAKLTAAIGGPVHAWLEGSELSVARKAEKIAGPIAIGVGILSVFAPIAIGEWMKYQESKNGPTRNPQAQTSNGAGVPGTATQSRVENTGAVHSAALGFGAPKNGALDHEPATGHREAPRFGLEAIGLPDPGVAR